ncbi:hypothetical protein TNCV_2350411 [Trichonephila clavipes]|uniref:Uncharacterized protein n=1 Tax=Trichonephila clavipes TaxID=2585209 RepID=A0A8X6T0Z7_TRICX|nr:hypothetical protein TNCV_2350411 [Trichonephila clavipes]
MLNQLWHPDVEIDHFSNSILHTVVYGQIDSFDNGCVRKPSGQGIGSSQACHEFEPSTTKDPPCREQCTLNLPRTQTSSRWCGSRRGGCQLRCRPRHLTMVQNDEVHRQKPSCS